MVPGVSAQGDPGPGDAPDTPGEFGTHVRETGELWLLRVRGEIDVATSPKLEAVLDEAIAAQPARVIVELDSVTFLDSTGLRVLVEAQRRLQECGGTLVIDGMSEAVRRVLEVTGLLAGLAGSGDDAPG
jgi:anti-sigma B factor antagonist